MRKNKIKNIIYVSLITFIGTFLTQCDKEETPLIEPNQRSIFTSEMDFDNKVNVNQDIDFGDASPGVISRTWTFPENVVDIDGADNNVTSNKKIVKAFFNTPGKYNVTLNQTFKGEVFADGKGTGSNVADTTIVVNVLSAVNLGITANLLNDDGTLGTPLVIADNAENEVTASKKVRFSYIAEGEPDTFDWTFNGATPETFDGFDVDVDVTYRSLGVHDLNFIASRNRPAGADTIFVKNLIKVVPSTEPVTLDAVNERDGKIGLEFSRDMDAATTNPNDFTVSLENGGMNIPVTISEVTVDTTNPNVVLVTLNETVYRDDVVKIAYTPGALATTDQVQATAIPETIVGFERIENIFDTQSNIDHSFENSNNTNWVYAGWDDWDTFTSNVTSTQAKSGTNSIYLELDGNLSTGAGKGMVLAGKTNTGDDYTFSAEAGVDYEIGVWTYLVDRGNPDPTFTPDVRLYWFPDTDWSVGPNPGFTPDFNVGEWVYTSVFVKFNETGEKTLTIRGWNEFNNSSLKFYMDDLTLRKVNLRP